MRKQEWGDKMTVENLFRMEKQQLAVLDNLRELVFNFKLDGEFFYVNSVWVKTLGYERWEAVRMNFGDVLQDDQQIKWRKIRQRLGQGVGYSSVEFVFKTKKKEEVVLAGSLHPMAEDGDSRTHIVGIFQDVTEIRQAEKERDRLFSFSIDMLAIVGFDGTYKRVNPAFHKTLGFSEEEFLQKHFIEFVHPEDKTDARAELARLRNGIPSVCFETRCLHLDGSYRWLSWTAHPVPSQGLIYAVARDVTCEKEMKETLKEMAFTDALTGLYNRRGFYIVAERMLKIASRKKMGFLLMMADLDDMKSINDRFGHPEGDAALIATAKILRERFRDSDLLARIGGDEFVVALLTNGKDESETIKKNLKKIFSEYGHPKAQPYPLSLSMGFTYVPTDIKASIEEILARADSAMYENKRLRRAAA